MRGVARRALGIEGSKDKAAKGKKSKRRRR
jgi:hypothetical protein